MLVAVLSDSELIIHGPPSDGAGYATLCGLDDDDESAGTRPAEVPRGAKINCPACRAIWETARTLKRSQFA